MKKRLSVFVLATVMILSGFSIQGCGSFDCSAMDGYWSHEYNDGRECYLSEVVSISQSSYEPNTYYIVFMSSIWYPDDYINRSVESVDQTLTAHAVFSNTLRVTEQYSGRAAADGLLLERGDTLRLSNGCIRVSSDSVEGEYILGSLSDNRDLNVEFEEISSNRSFPGRLTEFEGIALGEAVPDDVLADWESRGRITMTNCDACNEPTTVYKIREDGLEYVLYVGDDDSVLWKASARAVSSEGDASISDTNSTSGINSGSSGNTPVDSSRTGSGHGSGLPEPGNYTNFDDFYDDYADDFGDVDEAEEYYYWNDGA